MFYNLEWGLSFGITEILFAAILIGCQSAGLALMFKKANKKAWIGAIPVLNILYLFKNVWNIKPCIFLLLAGAFHYVTTNLLTDITILSLVSSLVLVFVSVTVVMLLADKTAKAYNRGAKYVMGLVFVPMITYLVIGCESEEETEEVEETEEGQEETEPKLSRKERKKQKKELKKQKIAEKKATKKDRKKKGKKENTQSDRIARGDGTQAVDFRENKEYDAFGNVINSTGYELTIDEKKLIANLQTEKKESGGKLKRELTMEERRALEKLRKVKAIGM